MENEDNTNDLKLDSVWDSPKGGSDSHQPPATAIGQADVPNPNNRNSPLLDPPSNRSSGADPADKSSLRTEPSLLDDIATDSEEDDSVSPRDSRTSSSTFSDADDEELDKELMQRGRSHSFELDQDLGGEAEEDSTSSTQVPSPATSSSDSAGMSFLLIGALAAVLFLGFLAWLFLRKRGRQTAEVPPGAVPLPGDTTGPSDFHSADAAQSLDSQDLVDPEYDPFSGESSTAPAAFVNDHGEALPFDDEQYVESAESFTVVGDEPSSSDEIPVVEAVIDSVVPSDPIADAPGIADEAPAVASGDADWTTWSNKSEQEVLESATADVADSGAPEWTTWSKEDATNVVEKDDLADAVELVDAQPQSLRETASPVTIVPPVEAIEAIETVEVVEEATPVDVIDNEAVDGAVSYEALPPTVEPEWNEAWIDSAPDAGVAGIAVSNLAQDETDQIKEGQLDRSQDEFAEVLANLKDELHRVSAQRDELAAQRDGLAIQRDESQSRVNELEQQAYEQYNTRDGLIAQCTDVQNAHDAMLIENKALRAEIETIQASSEQLAAIDEDRKVLQVERDGLASEREQFQSEREQFQSERERFQSERVDADSDRQRLESERQDLSVDRARLDEDRRDLEADRERLATERQDWAAEREQSGSHSENLSAEQERLEAERLDLVRDRERLEEDRRDMVADRERLAKELRDVNDDRQRLDADRQGVRAERDELLSAQNDVNAERERIADQKNELAAEIERKSAEHAGFLAERDQFSQQLSAITEHDTTVAGIREELAGVERMRDELKSELDGLVRSRDEAEARAIEKEEEAAYRATVEKDDLSSQLEEAVGRRVELEEEMAEIKDELQAALGSTDEQMTELSGRLQTTQQKAMSLESSLRNTEAELALALSSADEAQTSLSEAHRSLAELDAERDARIALEASLNELKKRAESAELEVTAAVKQSQQEREASLAEVAELSTQNESLQTKMSVIEEQLSTAEIKARAIVEAAAQQTEERLARLAKERDTAIRAWGAAEQRATEVQTELRDSQFELDSLQDQHQSLVEQLEASQTYRFRADRMIPAADLATPDHPLVEVESLREALESTRRERDEALQQVDELYSRPEPRPPAVDVGPAFETGGNGYEHTEPLFESVATMAPVQNPVESAEVVRLRREVEFARRKAEELQRSHDLMAGELHRSADVDAIVDEDEVEEEPTPAIVVVERDDRDDRDEVIDELRDVVTQMRERSAKREDALRGEFAAGMATLQTQLASLVETKSKAKTKSSPSKRKTPARKVATKAVVKKKTKTGVKKKTTTKAGSARKKATTAKKSPTKSKKTSRKK